MAAKVPIRAVFDGTTATGLAEFQSSEFIALAYGGLGASLSLGSAGQILKVNSAGDAVEFGSGAVALDDVSTGDAASTLATSAGNITIDAQGNNTDIIFKGTDASSDITMLTLDGSEAGAATFNDKIVATELDISGDVDVDGTLEADAYTVDGTTLAEFISDTAGGMVSSNTETGITVTYQDADNTIDFAIDAAQTTITSIYATDLIMGEDSQTAIDFGTANEIDFKVDNAARLTLTSGALYPVTDNEIDLGTSSLEFKDAYFDGTVTSDAFAGPLTGDVTGTSSKVTVSDSTANTNFPVVFHDESDSLLDDTGALRYNPSTGELLVPKLTVAGTTTTVDTVTMQASNAIIFEGATADAHETTLSVVDPTGDHTQYLINQGGYIPLLAAATTTAISSTPAELNLLDGSSANSVVNSKAVIYGSSGELAGVLSTGAQTGITSIYNTSLAIGYGSSHANIDFGTDNRITFDIDGTSQVILLDGVFRPTTDSDVDLGASAKYWKDAYIDTITTTGLVTAGGRLITDDATEATSTTDGSLQTDGGLSVAKDIVAGDDIKLLSDASVIAFGTNGDVTLTHVHDTGILLNSTMAIQFNDASQYINAPSNAILDINATDEIELNATLVDVNANLDVSGTGVIAGALTSAAFTASGIIKTDDATEATSTTDGSLQTDGGLSVVKDAVFGDDIKLLSDSAVIHFGADSDITLTHAADTSLTTNGVMIATTFEPSGDTASGDNAAIGYAAADGLILTGQGSTADVSLKNDADTTVCFIPTGAVGLKFPDGNKILAGTGDDLQIWHDGSHSYVKNAGTGNLFLDGANVNIRMGTDGGENAITCADNGAVTLFYDNASKLATTSSGVTITGTLVATDVTGTKSGAKCWGYISRSGGTPSLSSPSYNIASVSDDGDSQSIITIDTDMASAVYAPSACLLEDSTTFAYCHTLAAGSFKVKLANDAGGSEDDRDFSVVAFGDQ